MGQAVWRPAGHRHLPGTGWDCSLEAVFNSILLVFTLKWCAGFWEGICLADLFWTWTSSCAKEDFKMTWVGRQPSQRSGRVSSEGWHDRWLSCRTLANCFPVSAAQWIVNYQASQDPFSFLCYTVTYKSEYLWNVVVWLVVLEYTTYFQGFIDPSPILFKACCNEFKLTVSLKQQGWSGKMWGFCFLFIWL